MKMKKYLMTGISALALCVGFTSCSHDFETLSPEEIDARNAQMIVEKYEKAFEATFGKPAANHNWGFGPTASARTRGNYADSNHWGATAESDPNDPQRGWIVPDTLTNGQRLRVTRYFQTHPYLTYVDPQWEDFFVQQVYTGGTNVLNANTYSKDIHEPNAQYGYSPEIYRSGDKLSTEAADITSNKLNYLFAYGETEHINNFNAATASYKPVLEVGEDVNDPNKKMHNDRINLMVHSSTQEFSYQNAYSSNRHALPYVALVGAETIDLWADSVKNATGETIGEPVYYGQTYSGKDNSYWNRSFLGCDLELLIGEEIYDGTTMKLTDASSFGATGILVNGQWSSGIPGGNFIYNGNPVRYLKHEQNQYGGDLVKLDNNDIVYDYRRQWTDSSGNHDEYMGKVLNTAKFEELLGEGYLPVAGTELKNWVRPTAVADHYYSDWIVTLCEAKRQGEEHHEDPDPTTLSLRVMAEDLSVDDPQHDFDFNDVVFDVIRIDDNNAKIILQAAGGTLPLRINCNENGEGGWEVHEAYGVGTNIMINTNWNGSNASNNAGYKELGTITIQGGFSETNFYETVKNIPVRVQKVVNSQTGEKRWFSLEAPKGMAPSKFGCPVGTQWVDERVFIDNVYNFSEWVQGLAYNLTLKNQSNQE